MTHSDTLTTFVWASNRDDAVRKAKGEMRQAGEITKVHVINIRKTGQKNGKLEEHMVKARVLMK